MKEKLFVTSSYLLSLPATPPAPLNNPPVSNKFATCHSPCPSSLVAPMGGNNRDRRAKMAAASPRSCLARPQGACRVSSRPILMHVFCNKLASLLKSLLWPMNIWCGQGLWSRGIQWRGLILFSQTEGVGSWPDPEHSTSLLRSGRAPIQEVVSTTKHFFSSFVCTFWSVLKRYQSELLDENQNSLFYIYLFPWLAFLVKS